MVNNRDSREQTIEKIQVTWEDVEQFITSLKPWIKENKFTGVYGPARGGLVFAVMISHRYNLPFLGAPQVGCLCVDDICDSGVTALAWKEKGYSIATMYYKENDNVTPNMYFARKGNKWIQFPWE